MNTSNTFQDYESYIKDLSSDELQQIIKSLNKDLYPEKFTMLENAIESAKLRELKENNAEELKRELASKRELSKDGKRDRLLIHVVLVIAMIGIIANTIAKILK